MTEELRPDGKPFVLDKRGVAPRYVIEDGADGMVLTNQYTGESVEIEERTWAGYFRAHRLLKLKEKDQ